MSIDPFAAFEWLGIPLHLITDQRLPLHDVAPQSADRLEHLFYTGQVQSLVGAKKVPSNRSSASVQVAARRLQCGASVCDAASAAGLSERQLERLFQRHVGMAPKTYSRVLRLRRGVSMAKAGETLSGAAALAGFADQSHFTREAQDLCGASPQRLIPRVGNIQDVVADVGKI